MWNKLFEIARWIILFAENSKQVRADVNALQQEVKRQNDNAEARERELHAAIERLVYEIRRVAEHDENEREKLLLKIENQLLRLSLPQAVERPIAQALAIKAEPHKELDEASEEA